MFAKLRSCSTCEIASTALFLRLRALVSSTVVSPPSASKSLCKTKNSSSSSPLKEDGLNELSYFKILPKPEQIKSEPPIRYGRILAATRISDSEWRASFPDAHSKSSQTAIKFSAIISRTPPGIEPAKGAPSIPPFCVP